MLKHRESQLLKQVEDLQKDCLRNLADRQNEVTTCLMVVFDVLVNISVGLRKSVDMCLFSTLIIIIIPIDIHDMLHIRTNCIKILVSERVTTDRENLEKLVN